MKYALRLAFLRLPFRKKRTHRVVKWPTSEFARIRIVSSPTVPRVWQVYLSELTRLVTWKNGRPMYLAYCRTSNPFALFFQFGTHCSRCGQFLYRVIQPTADLQTESEEYIRRSKLNAVLDAGYQLQAWGILPFDAS